MASELKLRKLKEGVDRYVVDELLVKPGETVQASQPIMTVSADKASGMEVEAPTAGKIVQFRVKVGDEIGVGDVYCLLDGEAAATSAPAGAQGAAARQAEAQAEPKAQDIKAVKQEVRPTPPTLPANRTVGGAVLPAGPSARWLARKLGVDLHSVRGSGPNGRITEDDVKNAFGGGSVPLATPVSGAGAGPSVPPLPNFAEFGPIDKESLTRVRRLTAQKMSLAWSLIPHVTQHDQADVTDLEAFRKQQQEGKGPKLTALAFALKACAIALKQFPTFNASLDLAGGQLILKKYYNIGVAVDTKGGLLVPVIRNVDKKSVAELAQELTETGEKAREGKVDMSGGTFTISNLGGIGGTGFTPIVNYPEVAILGMSRSRLTPVVRDGVVVPRLLLPLSLSYDHRVIDGAEAARFTRRVAEMLENPWVMILNA